jgi:hypothetical protein
MVGGRRITDQLGRWQWAGLAVGGAGKRWQLLKDGVTSILPNRKITFLLL